MRPSFKLFALLIISSMLVSGCGSSLPTVKPFKMDIQQGNVVTSKMLLQLKPGMTKSQVRFIMGTPLVVDSFHKDRWDYFYQMRQAGKIVEQRRVILDFEKELLAHVRGDVVPQGALGAANGGVAAEESSAASAPITIEPKTEETTMWDKLKFWKKDGKPIAKKIEADAPLVAPVAVTAAVEKVTPKTDTAEKTLPEKTLAENINTVEKPAEEKSWVDKLKFWKKDAAVASAKNAVPATSSTLTAAAPSEESISVMNAPVELPNVESAPKETAVSKDSEVITEPLKVEPQKVEPQNTELLDMPKKLEITGKESMEELEPPSQITLPAKPKFVNPIPEKLAVPSAVFNKPPPEKPAAPESQLSRPLKALPLSAKKGEQLIFRMDKTLDLERGLAVSSKTIAEPAVSMPDAKAVPVKTELEPLPVEAEPSFFDKMLEKIGF